MKEQLVYVHGEGTTSALQGGGCDQFNIAAALLCRLASLTWSSGNGLRCWHLWRRREPCQYVSSSKQHHFSSGLTVMFT